MEETQVTICGAGPTGLAMGIALAKYDISSIILEKEPLVTENPRGAVLVMDACRMMYSLGIREEALARIGSQISSLFYHRSHLATKPFFSLDIHDDVMRQSVPGAIAQNQPELERELRKVISNLKLCEIRPNCEVIARQEQRNCVVTTYQDANGATRSIKSDWLVAADGKRGVVRKKFLEPEVGIRQITGTYAYEKVWIIANLKLTLPTRETHPEFPLWDFGLTPKQVYNLFWPPDWHFLSPPGIPTACGRIGRHDDFIWRHEIAPDNIDEDPKEIMRMHITQMATRIHDQAGNVFPEPVTYPADCIEILRCEAVSFAQKSVDRWYQNRTILVGDAAHVFPPFAGQGIVSGSRDIFTLAWRLALLLKVGSLGEKTQMNMLDQWAYEGYRDIAKRAIATKSNGDLLNGMQPWTMEIMQKLMAACGGLSRMQKTLESLLLYDDIIGLRSPEQAFHLATYNGGFKVAQIHLYGSDGRSLLSDDLLFTPGSIFTLVTVGDSDRRTRSMVRGAVEESGIHPEVLSVKGVYFIDTQQLWHMSGTENQPNMKRDPSCREGEGKMEKTFYPATTEEATSYRLRLGWSTKFAIIRPDYVVFATANDFGELIMRLNSLRDRLFQPDESQPFSAS